MKIICTICSRLKNDTEELLPARLRYLSPHVKATEKIAEEAKLPFFILSGKYGLISADSKIPNYDYYLENDAIDALAQLISHQLQKENITQIDFYTEGKPSWAPYELALQKGTDLAKISLSTHTLFS